MNKLITSFCCAMMAILPLQAQETAAHDNRMYITVGECSDISQVPISLHLENPSIAITAVEMYLTLPEGAVVSSSSLESRSVDTHIITDGDTPRGYFVSVASETVAGFVGTSGSVCTLMCDLSALDDGEYTIGATGMFAVGVTDNVITCYTTDDQDETVTKSDDKVTGIENITPDNRQGTLEIYNLQGIRLVAPQPGQINIINGKKIIIK